MNLESKNVSGEKWAQLCKSEAEVWWLEAVRKVAQVVLGDADKGNNEQ